MRVQLGFFFFGLLTLSSSALIYNRHIDSHVIGVGTQAALNQDDAAFVLNNNGQLLASFDPKTITRFSQREKTEYEGVNFTTQYVNDPELEWGIEELKQEGQAGQVINIYKIYEYAGEEYMRELISQERLASLPQVIARGTKVVVRHLATPEGPLEYTRQLRVWATSYDGNCFGCRGKTYSGTEVKKGVCAIDPKMIPLGSWFYVPGYGRCHAEDIGGRIKGSRIDLGFEDLKNGSWSARWVDIYLLP